MDSLTEGPIVKTLLTLALPIILANMLQTSYQLVNTFWVGRLGADAMAAVSISFPIIFLLVSLGGGLTVAGSILVAQYAGARNGPMVSHVAAQTFTIVISTALLFSVIGYVATPALVRLMGVETAVFDDAVAYMKISFAGMVFLFVFAMYQSIMRGVGQVRMPLYMVGASVVVNLALDPLLIFGWGPIPAGGVAGAAWATLLSEALVAAVGLRLLMGPRFGLELSSRDFLPDWTLIRRLFMLGLPASIEQSMMALGITCMTMLVARFGTVAIAAYGIGFRVLTFIIIPAFGISMATSTLVGQSIGAGNKERAQHVGVLSAWTAFLLLTGAGVLTFAGAIPIMRFFVPDDTGLIIAGATVVRFMAWSFGLIGIQMGLSGTFRGAGDTFISMALAIFSTWVLQLPMAWILSQYTALGSLGLWWSYPLSGTLATIATIAYFKTGRWKTINLTPEQNFQQKVTAEILIEEGRP